MISVTEKGRGLSERIAAALDGHEVQRYCSGKHTDVNALTYERLPVLISELWSETDALIFVCACGIAVRCIAPLVNSKLRDPAVIAADDCGKFVIPLLSGHIGGANALAKRLSERLRATAVITTATDIGGLFSPDSFAAANGLIITDMEAAKQIAAAVLEGERIGLVSDVPCLNIPPQLAGGSEAEDLHYGIQIVGSEETKPFPVTLRLLPKNIVLGVGCKRGSSALTIARTAEEALSAAGIPPERVCGAASIDLKSDEEGLREFCRERGLPIKYFTAEELSRIEGDFTASEFVRSVTGVDNVCERSAVMQGGRLIMRKYTGAGVTVAAAELPIVPDFERKML